MTTFSLEENWNGKEQLFLIEDFILIPNTVLKKQRENKIFETSNTVKKNLLIQIFQNSNLNQRGLLRMKEFDP